MDDQKPVSGLQIRLPLLLAATLALGMFIGQQLPHYDRHISLSSGKSGGALDEVLRFVEARYVDSVDVEKLKSAAIEQVLARLDPHSAYFSPDELEAVEDDLSGEFEGIGIEFNVVRDTIEVLTPMAGGPSEAAGIMAGDKIVAINGETVAGVGIETGQIYKKLRGAKGTEVKLGIRRGKESLDFTVARDKISVNSVETAYMLDDVNGYVKINRFTARTYQEFVEAVKPLVEKNGLRNLMIDLRGNPGGYLDEAVDILSQLFPEGKLLVYTQGRTETRRDYKSSGRIQFNIDRVAVLIDEGSASASEIVAGAVQDWDRGWVVGRRSFGKGLVQEQYPLSDGGGLRLTVSRYYTPSGRSIQRPYKGNAEYDNEAEKRLKNGELTGNGKVSTGDTSHIYLTGMGRKVFGGGGISPDVFIPLDTAYFCPWFFELRQFIPRFAPKWLDGKDKTALHSDAKTFAVNFDVTDEMVEALQQFTLQNGGKSGLAPTLSARAEIKLQLKARIAKLLFHDEGLYRVANADDPAIDKALGLLRSGDPVAKK